MNIAFQWYFDKAEWVFPNWRDGLKAAMELVGQKHTVDWYLGKTLPTKHYDFLLFWDDSNSEMFNHLDIGDRRGMCLTTDPHNIDNLRKLDVVFCESEPIYNAVRSQGIHAIKAFGTDTDFFTPDPSVEKDIQYFYPATFSPWKRQDTIAYLGQALTCIGTVQPDGVEIFNKCKDAGVNVMEGYFPVETIRQFYRRAKNVIIPAIHGSERTVLEAMSCNVWPEVHNPVNRRAQSYVEEYFTERLKEKWNKGLKPRQFILDNYSHHKYAEALLRGIENG